MGFGTVGEAGYPGYNAVWKKSTASIAEILRRHGYSTAAFGKWHNTPFREISPIGPYDHWPTKLGFDYYYGNMLGVSSQWEPELWRNTSQVQRSERVGHYHYTSDIIDDSIKWLSTQRALALEKPYFIYVAPGAAHAPHHVPENWIHKYTGKFNQGWDVLRDEIFKNQKKLGVIPPNTALPPRPPELPLWSSLSINDRRIASREMEVYAAFIEHTDHEIGRLIDFARNASGGDNTLVIYIVGDNGASAELLSGAGRSAVAANEKTTVENLGGPAYYNHYSAGWAVAGNTPFGWGKGIASHLGATRNPMVVSWPRRIQDKGGLRTQFTHVNDIASTLLDVSAIEAPSTIDGVRQLPFDGVTFAGSFQNADAPSKHKQQYFEVWGNRAIYKDGWIAAARHKLPWESKSNKKFDDQSTYANDIWELYNLDNDFAQASNIAERHPKQLRELKRLFDEEARKNDVYPLISGGLYGIMPPIERRKTFVFHAGASVPVFNAPQFINPDDPQGRSHFRIEADVLIPDRDAEGVIISYGSRFFGGFSLYIKDGRVIYEQNFSSGHATVVSSDPLPYGRKTLSLDVRTESTAQDGQGSARLWINDQFAGEAVIPSMMPVVLGYFGVGEVFGSAPTSAFETPFKFSGTIDEVRIVLR